MNRYEGVRFSDGSVAVRRVTEDPCERATLTFESEGELKNELGRVEVTWLVKAPRGDLVQGGLLPRFSFNGIEAPPPNPFAPGGLYSKQPLAVHVPARSVPCAATKSGAAFHRSLSRTRTQGEHTPQPSSYERTEETDEP